MDKHEIITRLNEITSYFSFGRILGYISFFETVGIESQLKHGQESNRDRLLSTEIDFYVAFGCRMLILRRIGILLRMRKFVKKYMA